MALHSLLMNSFGLWYLSNVSFVDWVFMPGTLIVLVLALVLDAIIGDPRWIPHPVKGIGVIIRYFDLTFNRQNFSKNHRKIFGFILVIFIVFFFALIGWFITVVVAEISFGWIIELIFIYSMVSQRSMVDHALRVIHALKGNNLSSGRYHVSQIVGRDVSSLNESAISRAAIESVAESFTDGVVAPVFWYLALGLPGILVFKAISTLDSMVGYRNEQYLEFGMAAARFDDFLNWLPARIAGPIIACSACFVPKTSPRTAFHILFRDASKNISPNAGWTEAAMAGALKIRLLGPRKYPGQVMYSSWIGEGEKEADPVDIMRAVQVYAMGCCIVASSIIVAVIIINLFFIK